MNLSAILSKAEAGDEGEHVMSGFRFGVGDFVMCNLGANGWKLGRVIALRYREDHWPDGQHAPYQVALEEDHDLIYVPEDDDRYCRQVTREDLRITSRMDALASLPEDMEDPRVSEIADLDADSGIPLGCSESNAMSRTDGYRDGRCRCCDCCPRNWSSVELYSEHYRCAERTGLKVTRHAIDLGTVRVGDAFSHHGGEGLPSEEGFMQCPTLVRLPPGVRFFDNGSLEGRLRFDPHRDAAYRVEFVAVSTARWNDPSIGIVRLEVSFEVEGNEPPDEFDLDDFTRKQQRATDSADRMLRELNQTWEQWELGRLSNGDTCDRMCDCLLRLRTLLETNPRLDGGRWWAQLGGYHMNVHKLLENALFECELYLGHALTFGDAEVRYWAERNLEGCYQKRLLEAARFMWIEGCEQMMRGDWSKAAETLRLAAAKKDGWGWAVNFGDIWFSESAARLVHGIELAASDPADGEAAKWIDDAARLLDQGVARTNEADFFGNDGHPWAVELVAALNSYRRRNEDGLELSEQLDLLKQRTLYWCAQILAGATPFPPKPRPRREDAAQLVQRLRSLSLTMESEID
ncbi:MAG: hypothetical protein AAF802_27220 [Planctomycetota bacterium]